MAYFMEAIVVFLPLLVREGLVTLLIGFYIDVFTTFLTYVEHYYAIYEGEECVVASHTYVEARMMLGATLTFQNVASLAL